MLQIRLLRSIMAAFIQSIINFAIVAFAIFMMIKLMNATRKKNSCNSNSSTCSSNKIRAFAN